MIDLYKTTPLALDANLNCDGLFIPFKDGYKLMQFTGMLDKNNNPIYEGDIVKRTNSQHGDFIAPIVFMGGAFTIDVFQSNMKQTNGDYIHWKQGFDQQGGLSIGAGIYWRMEEIEVIGNIYESPELIDNKELNPQQ
jgi:uncharacterized phage protein (TIGR01671 family)